MNTYPTYQDVKLYLNISTNKDDAILVTLLKRAIAIFENLAKRSFLPTTTTKYFSADSDEVVSWDKLFIRSEDLISVSQLVINGSTVPSDEYVLEGGKPFYKIRLTKDSDYSFKAYTIDPHNSIAVTGVWGYDDNIPEDVNGAIIRLTAYLYAQKDNALELDRTQSLSNGLVIPAAIPNDVERVAVFYRRIMQ